MSSPLTEADGAREFLAPAKTNLWLRILGKRDDGFHEIDTRMVCLALADRLRIRWRDDDQLLLSTNDPDLPTGEDNLVIKAVRLLEKQCGRTFALEIYLEKNIPSAAGLGGGSSDAATVLLGLNEIAGLGLSVADLAALAGRIGSDIPFFIHGRPCDCRGRGELIEPVPPAEVPPQLNAFLIKPAFGIAASWAYQHYAASGEYPGFRYEAQPQPWGSLRNDLERPVFEKFPLLGEMKSWLLDQPGVDAALLSGSGSTMLALLESPEVAVSLRERALERYGENCWTWCGPTR